MLVPARGGDEGTVDEGEADVQRGRPPEMTSLLPKCSRSEPPLPVKRMACCCRRMHAACLSHSSMGASPSARSIVGTPSHRQRSRSFSAYLL